MGIHHYFDVSLNLTGNVHIKTGILAESRLDALTLLSVIYAGLGINETASIDPPIDDDGITDLGVFIGTMQPSTTIRCGR